MARAGFRTAAARRAAGIVTSAVLAATVGFVGVAPVGAAPANNPLTIDMTANPSPVGSGQALTYTIVVKNTGGARVDEVVLTDVVNGMSGVAGTNDLQLTSTVGTCSQSNNNVRCDAGSLAGFQSWTVTIRGVVTADNGTVLNNTATVTNTKSATTFTVSDTTSTQVTGGVVSNAADLTVTVNAPSATMPNSDFLYTLTAANTGSVNATDIVLTASLPASVTFQTVNATNLFDCVRDGGTITCSGGTIDAGDVATIQVGVTAPATDQSLTLTSAIDPLNSVQETNDLNNAGQATTQVTQTPAPNSLVITKTDTPDPIAPGENLTYTLNVANTSASRADYLAIVDGTQGLNASNVTVSQATVTGTAVGLTCTVAAPRVTCETTRFQPGATATVKITGTVIAPPGSSIINMATVDGNIKNKGLSSSATAITTVRPGVDLTVTQYRTFPAAPAPVRGADRFDYTITVGNSGLRDARDVLVREPLPTGVVFDGFAASAAGTTCGAGIDGRVVECVIPLIKGAHNSGVVQGTTQTITLFLIAPHAIGPITSTVTVDPKNVIGEPDDESNNTFTTTTDVQTGIDLTVTKTDSPDPVARNGTLRYTITVSNEGTQDTTGVVVRDTLPTGSVFRTATGNHNFTCAPTGNAVECVGGILAGKYSGSLVRPQDTATITIDVFAPDEPGTYHNEVRVDPANSIPEIDESDNIEFEETVVGNGVAAGSYKELHIPSITENLDPVATNGTLDYTMTIRNSGAADAYNVVAQATLPAGSRFRAANDTLAGPGEFSCTHASGVVRCIGGTVLGTDAAPGGGTRKILISTFAPNDQGVALLEAMVDPENAIGEADEANNKADITTTVQAGAAGEYIDLFVPTGSPDGILDSFDPVAPDGNLTYTVTVQNDGAADAFGVAFKAKLPSGSTFKSADDQGTTEGSFACEEFGGVVSCIGARINAGTTRQVKINLFAPSVPDMYRLDVVVDPANTIPEGNEGNNAAEEFTTVQLGGGGGWTDLKIDKSDNENATTPFAPGEEITYTLKVTNVGTNDAFNVTVRDPLPTGVGFVSALGDGNFICQQAGGVVDCTGGHIKGSSTGGGERTITIVVTAPQRHGVTLINQAFVDPGNTVAEANETDNADTEQTKVESKIELVTDMQNSTVSAATEGDWKFSVTNSGSIQANNVTVVADLSPGVIPLNVSGPAGWACQLTENPVNEVTCVGNVAAGATPEFTVRVYRTGEGETLTSWSEVDPGNTIVEKDDLNNRDSGTA
ncbi:MAG TPA: CARDB domain-containing protein [Acidimicrobiales bacterium]|nr:CARDB domain-containing protein [Acidimicrobiales bacterium]